MRNNRVPAAPLATTLLCLLTTGLGACASAGPRPSDVPLRAQLNVAEACLTARPGDHVRLTYDVVYRTEDGAMAFTKASVLEGKLLAVHRDSLILGWQDGATSHALTSVRRIEKWCNVPHAVGRSALHGAAITGVLFGLVATAVAICNPAIFGDDGCMGGASAGTIATAALVGGGSGAVLGGAIGAGVGALTHHRWQTARLETTPPAGSLPPEPRWP